ncbi:Cyclin-dependent kinase-like 4 [Apiospora hydei]|uniref:Cyclin-dependent kinase-like 4 n=1 Tax=Apiospora hydei TaxID=1337664 RepID=A0ABR1WC46_9PEZI
MGAGELNRHFSSPLHPSANVVDLIRAGVKERLLRSKWDNHSLYLPIDAFESLFCMETIKSPMMERDPTTKPSELRYTVEDIYQVDPDGVVSSRRRILGIVTMMKQLHYIEKFIEKGIWDDSLPVTLLPEDATDWDLNDIILFNNYQQYFFVPFFDFESNTLLSYNFRDDTAMPWQECENHKSGGGGTIHRIRVHPSHHNYQPRPRSMDGLSGGLDVNTPSLFSTAREGPQVAGEVQYFAVKEIHSGDRETYKKELSALEKTFGKMRDEDHLIKLLLTFQKGGRFYLVFEWADGNLADFWEVEELNKWVNMDRWVYEQCLGIAKALKRIHGLSTWQKLRRETISELDTDDGRDYGRHGDIKAQNILWFKTYGDKRNHMVISNLGLTRYHSRETRSQVRYADIDGLTRQHCPPELDLGRNISQRYDIWSLGCLYLEFCTWYLQGTQGLSDFERRLESETWTVPITNFQSQTYFDISEGPGGYREAAVKPVVTEVRKAIRAATFP